MARPFTSKDAKRLIDRRNKAKSQLSAVISCSDQYKADIQKATDALVAQEALGILKDIPVEELNRDKKGFRIKALRDNGFNSIADVYTASVYTITAINGIGEDSAHSIKKIANGIAAKARQGTKIKLSTDSKTAAATQLVTSIYKYNQALPLADKCRRILSLHGRETDYATADIAPALSGLRWLFTSTAKKQRATEAYSFLEQVLSGEYGQVPPESCAALDAVNRSTNIQAWQDFTNNSIRYFNVLEDIIPGVLGAYDTVYGLPEDLAREIQEQSFSPDGLLCELRRYQEWGVKYILHQEQVLLGDEMGLGKTIQAIAAMVSLHNTGATHFAVVCPASVITNWCREIQKMSGLSLIKVHGTGRSDALDSWISNGGVAVTTYETTGYFQFDSAFKFALLVVDEAHYIKNPEAQRTANVRQLSAHAARTLFMTGTALENNVDEMIELIKLLQPRIAAQVQKMAFLSTAPQFREKIAPVYYRRKREDVLTELPDLIESKEWCTLLPNEEALYEQAVLSKRYADARRVSWNVDDLNESSKCRRLVEIVEEAKLEERKVIVFSFFLDTIRKIALLLGDKCLEPINGSVSPQRRQEIIDEFDDAPSGTVLVAQIQSGGTGLNIQSASVVVLCEPQFKPSTENQAVSRAYRMGQTRNVLVYRLLCEDTVDERIISILESKQTIFDAFADESAAAAKSFELDDKTFGDIIKDEIVRINAKYGRSSTADKTE